ncbi:hypothetical protein H4R35_004355 [Dimargaris xerosporica]|nr:hypothetical protein H4R35_004355 [Dimargaris xerosporica]
MVTSIDHRRAADADQPYGMAKYGCYSLIMRQQPIRSRMGSVSDRVDRRPIDPPPIIQLRVRSKNSPTVTQGLPEHIAAMGTRAVDPTPDFAHESLPLADAALDGADDEVEYLANPHFFMYVCLLAGKPAVAKNGTLLDQEIYTTKNGKNLILSGSLVSSVNILRDVEHDDQLGAFFVFPDLSIRLEGTYRLKFHLYELVNDQVVFRSHIVSDPFNVYSPKKFPGMTESTALSRSFAGQGLKIRIRTDLGTRKRYHRRKYPPTDAEWDDTPDSPQKPMAQPPAGTPKSRTTQPKLVPRAHPASGPRMPSSALSTNQSTPTNSTPSTAEVSSRDSPLPTPPHETTDSCSRGFSYFGPVRHFGTQQVSIGLSRPEPPMPSIAAFRLQGIRRTATLHEPRDHQLGSPGPDPSLSISPTDSGCHSLHQDSPLAKNGSTGQQPSLDYRFRNPAPTSQSVRSPHRLYRLPARRAHTVSSERGTLHARYASADPVVLPPLKRLKCTDSGNSMALPPLQQVMESSLVQPSTCTPPQYHRPFYHHYSCNYNNFDQRSSQIIPGLCIQLAPPDQRYPRHNLPSWTRPAVPMNNHATEPTQYLPSLPSPSRLPPLSLRAPADETLVAESLMAMRDNSAAPFQSNKYLKRDRRDSTSNFGTQPAATSSLYHTPAVPMLQHAVANL